MTPDEELQARAEKYVLDMIRARGTPHQNDLRDCYVSGAFSERERWEKEVERLTLANRFHREQHEMTSRREDQLRERVVVLERENNEWEDRMAYIEATSRNIECSICEHLNAVCNAAFDALDATGRKDT